VEFPQQGLTLVQFSAQRKHFMWITLGGFSDKTAQVMSTSDRVSGPASQHRLALVIFRKVRHVRPGMTTCVT
jgi:hypothetical protein